MHDWKGYLQCIQHDDAAAALPFSSSSSSSSSYSTVAPSSHSLQSSSPSSSLALPTAPPATSVTSDVRTANTPHTVKDCALSEVTISRCTYGELFVRAPSYREVLYRVDTVYQSYSRAVKIVAGILGQGKSQSDEMEGKMTDWASKLMIEHPICGLYCVFFVYYHFLCSISILQINMIHRISCVCVLEYRLPEQRKKRFSFITLTYTLSLFSPLRLLISVESKIHLTWYVVPSPVSQK